MNKDTRPLSNRLSSQPPTPYDPMTPYQPIDPARDEPHTSNPTLNAPSKVLLEGFAGCLPMALHLIAGVFAFTGFIQSAIFLTARTWEIFTSGILNGTCAREKLPSLFLRNSNSTIPMVFSLVIHLLTVLYTSSLLIERLCKKRTIFTSGGVLFLTLCLSILAFIAGIIVLCSRTLYYCSCFSANLLCNHFRTSGILNLICAFLCFLVFVLVIYVDGFKALICFFLPNQGNTQGKEAESQENEENEENENAEGTKAKWEDDMEKDKANDSSAFAVDLKKEDRTEGTPKLSSELPFQPHDHEGPSSGAVPQLTNNRH